MKQRYIYIIVAVLLVGAFSAWGIPWRKTSNSNTTLPTVRGVFLSSPQTVTYLGTLRKLYPLLNRRSATLVQDVSASDTLQWSYAHVADEVAQTFTHVLSNRQQLLQTPAQELLRTLQVQRIGEYWHYDQLSLQSSYGVYTQLLLSFYKRCLQVNPQDTLSLGKLRRLISAEIAYSGDVPVVHDVVHLIKGYVGTLPQQERLPYYQQLLGNSSHKNVLPFVTKEVIGLTTLPQWHKHLQAFIDEPTAQTRRLAEGTEKALLSAWQNLNNVAQGTLFQSYLPQWRKEVLPEKVQLSAEVTNYKTGETKVQLRGIVRSSLVVQRGEREEKGSSKTTPLDSVVVLADAAKIIDWNCTDQLPHTGEFYYETGNTGRSNTCYLAYQQIHVALSYTNDTLYVYTTNALTGTPIVGLAWQLSKTTPAKVKSDHNGCTAFPLKSNAYKATLSDARLNNGMYTIDVLPKQVSSGVIPPNPLHIFTDRPVYRTGQRVHVGLISVTTHNNKTRVSPSQQGMLTFMARLQGKTEVLDSVHYHTNDAGVAQASFTIPANEAITEVWLAYKHGKQSYTHPISLLQYQRQPLLVHLDSIPTGVVLQAPLVLYGHVTDRLNRPLPATVELQIQAAQNTLQQSFPTAANGAFSFVLDSLPNWFVPSGFYSYMQLSLRATDRLGHNVAFHTSLRVDSTSIPLSVEEMIASSAVEKEHIRVTTQSQPYRNQYLPQLEKYQLRLSLLNEKKEEIPLGEVNLMQPEVVYKMPHLASGMYQLVARVRDARGREGKAVGSPRYFFSVQDKKLYNNEPIWLYTPKDTIAGNDKLELLIGATTPSVVQLEVTQTDDNNNRRRVHLETIPIKAELKRIWLPAPSKPCQWEVALRTVRDGKPAECYTTVHFPQQNKGITIGLPHWGEQQYAPADSLLQVVTVHDANGRGLANVPIIATLYDQAVDDYGNPHFWQLIRDVYYVRPIALRSTAKLGTQEGAMPLVALSADANGAEPMVKPRKEFTETALFSALLRTNKAGQALLSCRLPDTQTRYHLKLFAFTPDLLNQTIKDEYVNVAAQVSVEVGLPSFVTIGDTLCANVLVRNHTQHAQRLQCTLQAEGKPLLNQPIEVQPMSVNTLPWRYVVPTGMADSLHIHAQVRGEAVADAVAHTLPVRSDQVCVPVAVPFSVYAPTEAWNLTLPKVQLAHVPPTLRLYTDPLSLVLSALVQDFVPQQEVAQLPLLRAIHYFVAYHQLQQYLQQHPAEQQKIVQALHTLQAHPNATSNASPRMASIPQRIAVYQLLSSPGALNLYLEQLEKQLLQYQHSNGGWGFLGFTYSQYMSLFVLESLSTLPYAQLSNACQKAIKRTTEFLEQQKHTQISVMRYLLAKDKLGLNNKPLPPAMKTLLAEQESQARKQYRNWTASGLCFYAEYAKHYEKPELFQQVLSFIKDRSKYPISEGEELTLKLFLAKESNMPLDVLVAHLLKHKQSTVWYTPLTHGAVSLLLSRLSPTVYGENAAVTVRSNNAVLVTHRLTPLEKATGEITLPLPVPSNNNVQIETAQLQSHYLFGGLKYNLLQPQQEVTPTGTALKVTKTFLRLQATTGTTSPKWVPIVPTDVLQVGEQVVVRYLLEADRDVSMVEINDPRPATLSASMPLVGYQWLDDGRWYSFRRLDTSDVLYIDYLCRGRHLLELPATVVLGGTFGAGPAVALSYYAPELVGNSAGAQLRIQ